MEGNERFGGVRDWIQAEMRENAVPSLAVAVAQNGRILWEEGFGWANREKRLPATEHTLYSLASISKPITTTGLMVLKQRGKVELDQPIDAYLGAAKVTARVGNAADATVRRVANHTSGLPLHYHFFYADEPYCRPPMAETIRRYANLMTIPGERYQYSNLGYGLLDYVIARQSGKSYADFMREEVFLPLGMTHASIDIGPGLEPFEATRYGWDGIAYPFYDFDHPGGSAVYCSAHDLVRFGLFHLKAHLPDQKAILDDATIDEMQVSTVNLPDGPKYGAGWGINEDWFGYRSVSHNGGMGGVSTALTMVPSEGLVIVALANAICAVAYNFPEEVMAALRPDFKQKRNEARAKAEQEKQDKADEEKKEPEFVPEDALLGEWKGTIYTYREELPFSLRFQPDGDVHAQIGKQLKTLVNEVRFKANRLTGEMLGGIDTEDANRRPYHLHLDLTLRPQALNGAVTAITHLEDNQGGAPGRRTGNALGCWAELTRVSS